MQLTTTTDTARARRPAGPRVLRRLDRPAAAGVIALVGWAAFVIARWQVWAHGQLTLFIMSGVKDFSHPAQMSPRVFHIVHVPSQGYDGQFYYRFALNPFNWHPTAYGITIDHNYRYTRIGYPLVTWVLSLGHAQAVPVVLITVNLACVAAIAWLGGVFARDSGRHALWGLLFAGYFGLVISVGRDTSEPLADACMLAALLAYRRSRYILAALLLAYGVITNEPVLIMAVGIALTRLLSPGGATPRTPRGMPGEEPRIPGMRVRLRFRWRPGREDLIWVLPGAAFVILQVLEKLLVPGKAGGTTDITANLTFPFWDMTRGLASDFKRMSWTHLGMYDINLIEFTALAVVVISALFMLRSTTAPPHERVGLACFVLIEIVMASWQFWGSVFGDGRTYIDSFLLACLILLATPSHAEEGAETTASRHLVTNKRLGVIAAVAAAALIVVARRRILFE